MGRVGAVGSEDGVESEELETCVDFNSSTLRPEGGLFNKLSSIK